MESCRLNSLIALLTYLLHYSQRIDPLLTHFDQFKTQKSEYVESCNETHSVMDLIFTSCNDTSDINNLLKANKHSHANCYSKCVYISQIGKEHLGLKAITEVLQDLQYKVGQSWLIRQILLIPASVKIGSNYCQIVVFSSGEEQDNPMLQPQHPVTWWAEDTAGGQRGDFFL